VNVLRLSLHPDGLAPRIDNLAEWRGHLLARLRQQIDASADAVLSELHRELSAYPAPASQHTSHGDSIAVPLRLRSAAGMLSLLSTTTVFGTPVDVTLSELAIEAFFPADAETAERLRAICPVSPER
jgi:MmyB-like transcription regulator ligand binding domain